MRAAFRCPRSRPCWPNANANPASRKRLRARAVESEMEQLTEEVLSPYHTFSRAEWAAKRADHPMTLTPEEVTRLRSLHDRLDMKEVEEIYLPLSRLLSFYVAAAQRLFRSQQG